jgi:lipopolysaccharide/colanic/teichoic acid biosynthesis glycosyltransferase
MTGGVLKRGIDIVVSAIALVVLSPLLALIAIAVRLDSPGPSLFRQTRVGRHEQPFTLLKFRSMTDRVDDAIHRAAIEKVFAGEAISDDPKSPFKLTRDPRVTRLGAFLRRTSLDELPQLYNVLKGEMSLVGPRPMIPYELKHFQDWHHERHMVRPGITGLAQVKSRGRANMDEILSHDVEYARTCSLRNDIKLVFQTIPIVFKGLGAR